MKSAHHRRHVRKSTIPAQAAARKSLTVRPRTTCIVIVAFALVFSALEIISYTQKSATWDEPIHLTAGYVALARHDYRVDPSHPPFLRMWAALPLHFLHRPSVDASTIGRTSTAAWLFNGGAYDFSRRFMYVENDADRLLYTARFMVVVWGVVLGILLFSWTNEWLGFLPAVFALIFYTMSPNIAAHASLVTTDFGVTCFIFGTIYFLWRTCRRVTALNLTGLTVFFVLAIVTKFSALILGPMVLLLLALAVLERSAVTVRVACGVLGLLAVAAFVGIWAIYGFRYAASAAPTWLLRLQNTAMAQEQVPALASLVNWIDGRHLLPNVFSQGLLLSQATVQAMPGFLMGRYSDQGWWYYFPVAFLIKTPVALIVLLFAGLYLYGRRWQRLGLVNEVFVALPIFVYLGFAMTSRINIGLRHILPIYPFVILVAVAAVNELISVKGRTGRIVLGILTVFSLARFGSTYPRTLTFFNEFVGGSRNGFKYLTDSNLDWGQHLKLLKRWMTRNGVDHINLAYFGQADPAYYQINWTPLPGSPSFALASISRPRLPGYVAISATVLSGVYLQPRWRLFYSAFHEREPVAAIGNSIRVYWVDRWPEALPRAGPASAASSADIDAHRNLADALLFAQRWPELAIFHYREYLKHRRYRPDVVSALANLGTALAMSDRVQEAVDAFRLAVDLEPDNGRTQSNLARALLRHGQIDQAAEHARQAVTLSPDDPAAHDLLGLTLAVQGKLEEAAMQFEQALRIDPTYEQAREHLARSRQEGR